MTEQFFEKELAARKIEAIPGLMEFDIPVRGDNRGWFKENFQKEKMLPLGFPESFFAEGRGNLTMSRLPERNRSNKARSLSLSLGLRILISILPRLFSFTSLAKRLVICKV